MNTVREFGENIHTTKGGGCMNKVVITGIDTNSLPKLSGKEQLELMIKLKKLLMLKLHPIFSVD